MTDCEGLEEQMNAFDKMLAPPVEILEEKGILTNEEYERRIEKKIRG
ncbi:MAG: hypothetical protein IB616_05770 [Methanosarcinales archaeon]|nr:MAG: hypothetical protein IB616_05770 [Methanosarcinales archaeon]